MIVVNNADCLVRCRECNAGEGIDSVSLIISLNLLLPAISAPWVRYFDESSGRSDYFTKFPRVELT